LEGNKRKIGSIKFYTTNISDRSYDEAVQHCIQNKIILIWLNDNNYELYFSLKDIKKNITISDKYLEIYKTFSDENDDIDENESDVDNSISDEYHSNSSHNSIIEYCCNNINIEIDNDDIRIYLNNIIQENVEFFEWKINKMGCTFIINNEYTKTENISIKNIKNMSFDRALLFNNDKNSIINNNGSKNAIENSIEYFQFTYTGKKSFFIINGDQIHDNLFIQGSFSI
jgi:hypothetical protein